MDIVIEDIDLRTKLLCNSSLYILKKWKIFMRWLLEQVRIWDQLFGGNNLARAELVSKLMQYAFLNYVLYQPNMIHSLFKNLTPLVSG